MDKMIHTVLGLIEPEKIGFTQSHEHIVIDEGQSAKVDPALCIDDPVKSAWELSAFRISGGSSIVDAQPGGCGRNVEKLLSVSKESGVNIIASTGFHKMKFYPEDHWIRTITEEKASELFTHELLRGMYDGTDFEFLPWERGAKAGIIKTAFDVTELGEPCGRLFRAAAEAQKVSGAPFMVHIERGSDPVHLKDFLKKQGVPPEKTYFCHLDRACDSYDVMKQILDSGITLEFDTIGRPKYHDDMQEIKIIRQILSYGYEDQLLISLDTTRKRLRTYDEGAIGLTYILHRFIPMMLESGISEKQIKKMTVENPRRILQW